MQLPNSFTTKTFGVIAMAVGVYATVTLFVGWDELSQEFQKISRLTLLGLTLLSFTNYVLRFWRWEIYLRACGADIPIRASINLYFATYLMVITPGKIGEVFKASILQENHGFALSEGLPVVIAERITDFLAVLTLAALGIFFWPGTFTGLTAGLIAAAGIPVILCLFQWQPVRRRVLSKVANSPHIKRYQVGLDKASATLSNLLGLRIGGPALVISIVAWFAECVGLWLVCRGLEFPVPIGQAIFIYTAGTIVGSLSMLPGGIGGTEAVIIWLLRTLETPGATATSAALIVRLFTLWLAVVVGMIFFAGSRKMLTGGRELRPPKVGS